MAAGNQPPRSNKPAIKYRRIPLVGPATGHTYIVNDEKVCNVSNKNEQRKRKSEPKSSELMSTTELVSAVGQILNHASRLPIFQPKPNSKGNRIYSQENKRLCYLDVDENTHGLNSKYLSSDLKIASEVPPSLEILKVTKIVPFFQYGLYGKQNLSGSFFPCGISYDFGNIYGWMSKTTHPGLNVDNTQTEEKTSISECIGRPIITSLSSDYFLRPAQESEHDGSVIRARNSGLIADYHVDALVSDSCVIEGCEKVVEDRDPLLEERKQDGELFIHDEMRTENFSMTRDKLCYLIAKQEHAFAGALAGTFVSLWLHPIDTVKTVIQSCRADQQSIFHVCRSIISERGLTGLYRGISSNIASSAPISALYTFTYESVKGALLPLFPKEYYSFAHCIAGGCASIATSSIFTPSERIKQQMQVGSHYQNCWHAVFGILAKGGLPSLYAGWGAVLCRNIPHSIIKFYTYESLKQSVLSSQQSDTQPSTLQTLGCGGLAGSTAALFTTPFDVVKTRLQTQIPGSTSHYVGVYHALTEIAKHEGLKGLYRGLTPRLIMYVSQGALFFASYEFFKSLFSLKLLPNPNPQIIQSDKQVDSASSSLSSSKLHSLPS